MCWTTLSIAGCNSAIAIFQMELRLLSKNFSIFKKIMSKISYSNIQRPIHESLCNPKLKIWRLQHPPNPRIDAYVWTELWLRDSQKLPWYTCTTIFALINQLFAENHTEILSIMFLPLKSYWRCHHWMLTTCQTDDQSQTYILFQKPFGRIAKNRLKAQLSSHFSFFTYSIHSVVHNDICCIWRPTKLVAILSYFMLTHCLYQWHNVGPQLWNPSRTVPDSNNNQAIIVHSVKTNLSRTHFLSRLFQCLLRFLSWLSTALTWELTWPEKQFWLRISASLLLALSKFFD